MEELAISGRITLHALGPQNKKKNEDIARYERKRMVFGFTGFPQLLTPGQVIDLDHILTKVAKFCLEGCVKKFYN